MESPESLLAHAHFVRNLAEALLRDPHAADDLAQEVWLSWLRRPARSISSLGGWLTQATRHRAANQRRAAERRARHEELGRREEPFRAPDEEVAEQELLHRLVDAVYALEEPYRTVVLARHFRGLDARALAVELGLPLATVRGHERRALELLRRRLEQSHGKHAWAVVLGRILGRDESLFAGLSLVLVTALMLTFVGLGAWSLRRPPTVALEQEPLAHASATAATLIPVATTASGRRESLEPAPTTTPAATASLVEESTPSAQLRMTVREEGRGPLAGVFVQVEVCEEDRGAVRARELEEETDAAGQVEFTGLPPGVRLSLALDSDPGSYVDNYGSALVSEGRLVLDGGPGSPVLVQPTGTLELEAVLPAIRTVRGRVLDLDGRPCPDARVGVAAGPDPEGRLLALSEDTATDRDGAFELAFRPWPLPGERVLMAEAAGPEYHFPPPDGRRGNSVRTDDRQVQRVLGDEELESGQEFVLQLAPAPTGVLCVEVREADGTPCVLGKHDWSIVHADGRAALSSSRIYTPPGGVFGIDLPPGSYRVALARTESEAARPLFLETDALPADGKLRSSTLQESSAVRMRVKGTALDEVVVMRFFPAEPRAGAVDSRLIDTPAPWLEGSSQLHTPELRGTALTVVRNAQAGEARLVLGPPGFYRVGVRRFGYPPLMGALVHLDEGEHPFQVAPPVASASLRGILRADPTQAFHALELLDASARVVPLPERSQTADPCALLTLPASGEFRLDALPPGRYVLRAGPRAELRAGRARVERELELLSGDNPPLELAY